MKECCRVLKAGGIIRVVVPDLENIVTEYLKFLNQNLENPGRQSEANYDWILLEMFDQTVRNTPGGLMAEFLKQPDLVNEKYIFDRFGHPAKRIRGNYLQAKGSGPGIGNFVNTLKRAGTRKVIKHIAWKLGNLFSSRTKRVGAFRLGGEVHMWMYDRFSLSRLLQDVGFQDIEIKTPQESNIPHWSRYELDVKNGEAFDPTSLFMEAVKPR